MMNMQVAQSQLKALGLEVSKTGRVSKSDLTFGQMENHNFLTTDRSPIPWEVVDHFEYVDADDDLYAVDDTGARIRIRPEIYTIQDKKASELKQMPKSLSELEALFPSIYPDLNDNIYYDELLEVDMVNMELFGMPSDGMQQLSDKILAIYYADMERRLDEMGYVGRYPSSALRNQVLDIVTYKNRRNLFREWVEAHPWDGKPRVRTWFRKLFGATAPAFQDAKLEERYLGDVSEAWFIGTIRRQYRKTKHEIVPVLIGYQGIGKGNALRFMAGQDCWYAASACDMKRSDKFLDSVRGAVVVELSEAVQLKNDDANTLKNFISMDSDRMRKAYDRYGGDYPRHFALIATSNLDSLLSDETGARRFFPMYCEGELSEELTHYDVEQVWAEALQMLRDGKEWYLSEDAENLAVVMQDFSSIEDSNTMMIDAWLDDPINGYAEVGSRITKETILDRVYSIGSETRTPVPSQIADAFNNWVNGTRTWRKISKTVRIGGRVCRAYERIATPDESFRPVKLAVNRRKEDRSRDPASVMRRIAREFGCESTGDLFPTEQVDQSMLEALLAGGYIYECNVGEGEVVYKVGEVR